MAKKGFLWHRSNVSVLLALWWFGVWGFGVGVLYWVFGVGVFSWWGLGPVVWGLLGFLGWGSLYKHKRITLGKKSCLCDTRYLQTECPDVRTSISIGLCEGSHTHSHEHCQHFAVALLVCLEWWSARKWQQLSCSSSAFWCSMWLESQQDNKR